MTASWDKVSVDAGKDWQGVSRQAKGWDSTSRPADVVVIPVKDTPQKKIAAEKARQIAEERNREEAIEAARQEEEKVRQEVEAQTRQAVEAQGRREMEIAAAWKQMEKDRWDAAEKARKDAEKAIRDEEARLEKEEKEAIRKEFEKEARIKRIRKGFLLKRFALSGGRIYKAVLPIARTVLLLAGSAAALTLMYKLASVDLNALVDGWKQCAAGAGNGPGKGDGKDGGKDPDGKGGQKGPGGKGGSGDDQWGWDKYFKDGEKIYPSASREMPPLRMGK